MTFASPNALRAAAFWRSSVACLQVIPSYSPEFTRMPSSEMNGRSFAPSSLCLDGLDHLANFDSVLRCKFKIALVVSRHAHDGAGAVVHEDVIGHPDGHALAVIGIDGEAAGGNAVFVDGAHVARFPCLPLLVEQLRQLSLSAFGSDGRESRNERMLRSQLNAGCAKDGVDARGEDANLLSDRLFSRPKSISVPSLRPIQLRCMVRTFSGQPSSLSRPSSSSCA